MITINMLQQDKAEMDRRVESILTHGGVVDDVGLMEAVMDKLHTMADVSDYVISSVSRDMKQHMDFPGPEAKILWHAGRTNFRNATFPEPK